MFILFAVLLFGISIYLVSLAPQLYIIVSDNNGISINTRIPSSVIPQNGTLIRIGIPDGSMISPDGNVSAMYIFLYSWGSGVSVVVGKPGNAGISYVYIPADAVLQEACIIYNTNNHTQINPAPIIYNGGTYYLHAGQSVYIALVEQGAIRPPSIIIISDTVVLLIIVFAIDIFIVIKAAKRMGVFL